MGLYELSDVDECAEGIHSCSSKAECTDIDGGYYCNSTEGSISDSHGNGQLGERVTMETIVMVTDDRAVLIGLIAPLAAISSPGSGSYCLSDTRNNLPHQKERR